MNLLLDTHTYLWHAEGDSRLSQTASTCLQDINTQISLSVASLWERAIKINLGKLQLSQPFGSFANQAITGYSIRLLPIELGDCERVISLPLHHRDPFDRMIVIHAIHNQLSIVSADPQLDQYGITRIW